MNFGNYHNKLSSHQDEINQINQLYLNITSKGLIMDEMPHVELYKKFDRVFPAKLNPLKLNRFSIGLSNIGFSNIFTFLLS